MMRRVLGNYRVAAETLLVVAILIAVRAVLWGLGVTGMSASPLASSIVAGGIFVMGLVVAGTLSDYRDAERAPTDIAAGLYAILREAESMNTVWGRPDLTRLRERLIRIVTTLRADINAGNTRDCQAAIEEVSDSLLELEESDVPANYVVRMRTEQSGLRKSLLRVYHIQREEFLPSAKAMIQSIVIIILILLIFTDLGGFWESLATVGFLSFFFVYLLRLLSVIDKPFKVGSERTEDDVSLFLLTEFMVHAQAAGTAALPAEHVAARAEAVEEQLTAVEEVHTAQTQGTAPAAPGAGEPDRATELAEAARVDDAGSPPGPRTTKP